MFLPAGQRPGQPWRNGGGVTYEIVRAPHPRRAEDFLWRVSIAEVALPGPFSLFAGHERLIAVIDGPGMRLRGLGAADIELRPFQVLRFDGAARVEGWLPHGTVKDLNVIFDPALCRATLTLARDGSPLRLAARITLVVNVGTASCEWHLGAQSGWLARFDALQFTDSHTGELQLAGTPTVALVEIHV